MMNLIQNLSKLALSLGVENEFIGFAKILRPQK